MERDIINFKNIIFFFQKYFWDFENGQKKCPKSERSFQNPEKTFFAA